MITLVEIQSVFTHILSWTTHFKHKNYCVSEHVSIVMGVKFIVVFVMFLLSS